MSKLADMDANPAVAGAADPESQVRRRAGRALFWRGMAWLIGAAVAWNAVFFASGLWFPLWWLGLFGEFVLAVLIAERVGRVVPLRGRRAYERTLAFGFPVMALVAWQLIVDAGILSPTWFPQPTRIAQALWEMTVSYDRFSQTSLIGRPWLIPEAVQTSGWAAGWSLIAESHVWATLGRVGAGFFIGAIPGILLGVVMGMNKTVRLMLDTTLSAIYVLPKIAIFPIVMLMFADPFGEGPKIVVVGLSVFFLMTINSMAGVRDIDPVFLMAGRNYGARGFQMLRHVIIPAALPVIFAGLRLALGTALIVIISVEFLRAKQGVGFITFYYWEVLNPEKMYAGLVVVMILGILLTYILQWVERRVMPWQRD
ncbi:MAG: ABC transporter permease [Rhodospirillales bacterium]|jgi:NitT/TauT family transport system permease protein|nr:ABC transporter permease [Rhodospirillales bacterium]